MPARFKHVTVHEGDEVPVAMMFIENDPVLLSWLPELFVTPDLLTDNLRREIVEKLRFHADKLESKEMDGAVLAGAVKGKEND